MTPCDSVRAMRAPSRNSADVVAGAEKSFYLDEFRAQTLCLSTRLRDSAGLSEISDTVAELLANGTRIVLILGDVDGRPLPTAAIRNKLREEILTPATAALFPQRGGRPSLAGVVQQLEPTQHDRLALQLWDGLRAAPLFVGLVPGARHLELSRQIAARLRIRKWVVLDPHGGINSPSGTPISFMDDSILTELLRAGAAEWAGLDRRRKTLVAVRDALRDGVEAINVCTREQLATELFTYEGAGTLFTLEDYCRVERLGIDDFAEVERLLQRGQREGFLKQRNQDQVAAILLNGFGATIGANHLAGVCALLTAPYKRSKAGEIAGLYTITRFKSEGVGGKLLRFALDRARADGLRYVFACTTVTHAAEFFKRYGFREVDKSRVPRAKWHGYGRERQSRLTVLRHDLT